MIIDRIWAMPNKETFKIKPIKDLINKQIDSNQMIIDPFANNSKIATVTNDLNPDFNTDFHLDAFDFLKMFDNNSIDVVLYDFPYSTRQVSESYKNVGKEVTALDTSANWRKKHLDEIQRILKPNGIAIWFGWNTNGVGKTRGFEMAEVLIVAHCGSHNDTLCTVEIKK